MTNFLKLISFLSFSILSLFAESITLNAQVATDLQLSVVHPTNNQIIPYGDTLDIMLSIRNNGPNDIVGDTLILRISGAPINILVVDTIAVGDTIIRRGITSFSSQAPDDNVDICFYLYYSLFNSVVDSNAVNDTACVSFVLKGSDSKVGIHDGKFTDESNLVIFPNPACDVLNIKMKTDLATLGNYTVFDQLGRLKQTGTIVQTQIFPKKDLQLNVSDLSPGLYYIQFSLGENIKAGQKFIISR